jgi:hypothetical protein
MRDAQALSQQELELAAEPLPPMVASRKLNVYRGFSVVSDFSHCFAHISVGAFYPF